MASISYRGSEDRLRQALRQLPAVLAGRAPDPYGVGRRVRERVADELLRLVRENFLSKSVGGAGADGVAWEPLSTKTLSRRGLRRGILMATGELLAGIVVEARGNRLEVRATSKPWHHTGVVGRLPARPFWPGRLPASWQERLLRVMAEAVAAAVAELARREG